MWTRLTHAVGFVGEFAAGLDRRHAIRHGLQVPDRGPGELPGWVRTDGGPAQPGRVCLWRTDAGLP